MIIHDHEQGSDEWLQSRCGVITGSRFRDCRAKLKGGKPSGQCITYSRDVARERVTGAPIPSGFVNAAMRFGQDQEQHGRMAYECQTGHIVQPAGFITTDDGAFGVSVDGLIGEDGGFECKTLVSTDTIFEVLGGDISAYIDQCNGALWLLGRKWWDLVIWVPDLEPIGRQLTIHHIVRNDDTINELEADLLAFKTMVDENEKILRGPSAQTACLDFDLIPPDAASLRQEQIAHDDIVSRIGNVDAIKAPAIDPVHAVSFMPWDPPMGTLADIHAADLAQPEPTTLTPAELVARLQTLTPAQPPEEPSLNLGAICTRLGFIVNADFVTGTLGIKRRNNEGRAVLFYPSDFGRICDALEIHIDRCRYGES